ncbi:MAG: FAD-binding oxidoreductase [Actinobacteria bacterium]|nr:FAD-binding oxidoreductase [Actinomycetota bacterium]
MIAEEVYQELEEAVGPENVSREPAVLDGYAYYTLGNFDPPWMDRPEAVVMPGSTTEVQAVVKACNRHKVRFKPLATGWEAIAAVGSEGVVQIDLRRLNRILEIDEKNMYAVVEPCVIYAQLQAEAMKRGLNCHIIGAGSGTSAMASSTSHMGVGWDSLYLGSGSNNILGLEWVLPSGELLELGSLGSGCGWFSGDGPGPSLRGIMRGWMGAHGGMGVFTKCALKLYNWPGKSAPDIEGMLLDSWAKTPENIRFYMCLLPDWDGYADFLYRFADAGIGYMECKNALGLFMYTFVPHLMRKITRTSVLREMLAGTFQHMIQVVIAANSRQEMEYEDMVLRKIVSETEGILMDASLNPALHETVWFSFVRASLPPLIFRAGGDFMIGFPQEDAFDAGVQQAKLGAEVKKEFIAKGDIMDDFGDSAWGGIFMQDAILHQEELALYDHRTQDISGFFNKLNEGYIEKAIGLSFIVNFGGRHDKYGPLCSDYHIWQRGVKRAFDKYDISDPAFYISAQEPQE